MILRRMRRLEANVLSGTGTLVLVLLFSFNQIYIPLHLAGQRHSQWSVVTQTAQPKALQPEDPHHHDKDDPHHHHHHNERDGETGHAEHSAGDHLCLMGAALPGSIYNLFLIACVPVASTNTSQVFPANSLPSRNKGPPSHL